MAMKKFSKNVFKGRLFYKIVAVLMAIVFWFYVVQMQNPVEERLFDVPLDFINTPANMAVSDKVDFVKVRIQGTKNVVDDVLAKDISAYLDLADANIGQFVGKIKIKLPEKVQLVSVNPIDVAIEIQEQTEVQLPVDVEYGTPKMADGYMMLSPLIHPEQVIITGPKDKIDLIDRVYVKIDLKNLSNNLEASVPVNIADENGNSLNSWLTVRPVNVDVFVPVITASPEKIAPISASLSGEPASGYMITRVIIQPSIIKAFGNQDILDKLSYAYTVPVNITGAKNDVSANVTLAAVDGIKFDSVQDVKVLVKIEPKSTKTLDNVMVNLINTNGRYDYQLSPNTVQVSVSGAKSVIDALSATSLVVEANMDGLSRGKNQVKLTCSAGSGIKVDSIMPSTITVDVNYK